MKNILIIEDEQSIADAVVHSIEREGFSATWCSLGNSGLAKLKSGYFALVVLDVGLPDISGFELCKQIRSFSNIPIIFLTARNDEVDKIVGLEIGGDDYITKPFSPRELGTRVKAVLRRYGSTNSNSTEAPAALSSKSLSIDPEKMNVVYHGQKLELTRYEFKLIALLAKSPGRVYSREMLLESVWDDATSSLDRTVDAHIKSLRSKLKAVFDSVDPIVTHRGTGYSLREDL